MLFPSLGSLQSGDENDGDYVSHMNTYGGPLYGRFGMNTQWRQRKSVRLGIYNSYEVCTWWTLWFLLFHGVKSKINKYTQKSLDNFIHKYI